MNNNNFINWINILSFGIGLYALYIALENLEINDKQSNELKQILHYLEEHLSSQDILFEDLSKHLAEQDKQLENLAKGI